LIAKKSDALAADARRIERRVERDDDGFDQSRRDRLEHEVDVVVRERLDDRGERRRLGAVAVRAHRQRAGLRHRALGIVRAPEIVGHRAHAEALLARDRAVGVVDATAAMRLLRAVPIAARAILAQPPADCGTPTGRGSSFGTMIASWAMVDVATPRAVQEDTVTDHDRTTLDPAYAGAELDPGQMVGRYVVRARQGSSGLLRRSGTGADKARARLVREARALAKLSHPNVVTVHDAGEHAGAVHLAMELVVGSTSAQGWTRAIGRSTRSSTCSARQSIGLAAAHAKGIVHRAFNPTT